MSGTPPRRGPAVAVALLAVGFLLSTAIAVIEFVQLRSARERVEELEAQQESGGLFGELGDALEEALGEAVGTLGDSVPGVDLFQCLAPDGVFGGDVGQADLGDSVDEQVDAIAQEVERIRELEFSKPVEPQFLSSQEAAQRIEQLFLQEYTAEAADSDERILTALGAIAPGTDLRRIQSEALGQQVVGFYDPETGDLVVRSTGEELPALDKVTLSHELEHALADQRLGLPLPDDPAAGREDADLAALAVVEGDATLTMQRFSARLSFEEQLGLIPQSFAELGTAPADVPYYLEQSLLFPYQDGLAFVCDLYADGGWDAVNSAYADPPDTSAQVLFPERYRAGEQAVDPRDPSDLPRPWRRSAVQQVGAANLLWLFGAPGGDPARALPDPKSLAGDWAGGEVHLWTRGEDSAVGISLTERAGGPDLCEAVARWYRAFADGRNARPSGEEVLALDGNVQDGVLACPGEEVRLGIAPDLGTARALTR